MAVALSFQVSCYASVLYFEGNTEACVSAPVIVSSQMTVIALAH
jgi:hypothetical protein